MYPLLWKKKKKSKSDDGWKTVRGGGIRIGEGKKTLRQKYNVHGYAFSFTHG